VVIPAKPVPVVAATPANSVVSPSVSAPEFHPSDTDLDDLEERMLQEAIRLSLEGKN